MRLRSTVGMACAALAVVAVPGTATASTASWELQILELPEEYKDAIGYVTGTTGRGDYSGYLRIGLGSQVVTWADGRPTVHGTPYGTEFAATQDQNEAGTIVGDAHDYETLTAAPFTLDATGFTILPLPEGARDGFATAINARGDVIGNVIGNASGETDDIVLWPADELEKPRVLKVDLPSADAVDIDDDGTVLISSAAGQYLWKDGRLARLEDPSGHTDTQAMAIKSGLTVGLASSSFVPGSTAFEWCAATTPTTCQSGRPHALPRGETATEINGSGLVVGTERTGEVRGPLAVWQDRDYVGRLPVPEGEQGAAGALAEDGTITGWVTPGDPGDGGQPAVWLPIW